MIELEGEPRSRRVLETLGMEAGYLISCCLVGRR